MQSPWSFTSLFETLATGDGRPAVVEVGESGLTTVTADELHRMAGCLAAGIKGAGLEPGTPVALIAANSARWITCWLGLTLAEAVVVALDDTASEDELVHQIRDCRCRFVFAGAAHLDTLARLPEAERPVIVALDDAPPAPARPWRAFLASEPLDLPALDSRAGAVTVYTSGTTGAPKSFTLTRANIAANVGALLKSGILGSGPAVVLALPLHHVYPLVVGCLTPLAAGAVLVLPTSITGRDIVRALDAGGAQVMVGVPRLYGAMVAGIEGPIRAHGSLAGWALDGACAFVGAVKRAGGPNLGRVLFRPLHKRLGGRLRILVSGGARLEPEIAERLESLGFEVLSGYGLAETASLFTGNLPGAKRIGTEGRVLVEGSAVRIASAGEDGVGEIELKGPNVFAGYLNNAQANAQAFTEDGWFRTGDLGRLDKDGFLSVTGRSKEMIVLGGGKNVFPEELEAHYGESPAIAEIAVLETEGRLLALVVPDLAALRADAKTRAEDAVRVALDDASRSLPSYQRLAGFAVTVTPLPRTRLGKYRRFLLPALYEQAVRGQTPRSAPRLSAEDREMLADPTGARVWAWLEDRYGAQQPSLDSHLQLELGLDSLEWIKVTFELESRLGLTLDESVFGRIVTARDLIREAISARAAPSPAPPKAVSPVSITPAGPIGRCFGTALFIFNLVLMRVLFRVRAVGREHLPAPGTAFLIAANHASDLDPALIVAALPLRTARRLWWGGEVTRLISGALGRGLGRIAHVFPVDERRPREALDLAGRILKRGDALGWFPESWRSPDGELQRFLPGIGRLLIDHPVPVVPAYIAGSFEAMPRTARLPRPHPVTIRFAAPVTMERLAEEGEGESREERIADGLRRRVAALEAAARA
jgi:long-chain acyl-CoA synthetase